MASILLVDENAKAAYLETCPLPVFYMGDFSIRGFAVGQYHKACDLLQRNGFTLLAKEFCADVIIDRPEAILKISALFAENGVEAQLSDIADSLYQA
ncbi:MAG: hypothetical protein P4L42_00390 [Desulfocapsaceae bacterium]|nr:hypothetical protein [Desulfocapsaceae bacterium]